MKIQDLTKNEIQIINALNHHCGVMYKDELICHVNKVPEEELLSSLDLLESKKIVTINNHNKITLDSKKINGKEKMQASVEAMSS